MSELPLDSARESKYSLCVPTEQRIVARMQELERADGLRRTQVWLARKLGVSEAIVSYWLNGEKPIPQKRQREISLVLGLSLDAVAA